MNTPREIPPPARSAVTRQPKKRKWSPPKRQRSSRMMNSVPRAVVGEFDKADPKSKKRKIKIIEIAWDDDRRQESRFPHREATMKRILSLHQAGVRDVVLARGKWEITFVVREAILARSDWSRGAKRG